MSEQETLQKLADLEHRKLLQTIDEISDYVEKRRRLGLQRDRLLRQLKEVADSEYAAEGTKRRAAQVLIEAI